MNLHPLKTQFVCLLFACVAACNPAKEMKTTPPAERPDYNVSFELVSDPVWQAPNRGAQTEILIGLEITNRGSETLRFPVMDKFRIFLQDAAGNDLFMEGGQDVIIPGNPVSGPIPPNGKYLLQINGQLSWDITGQLYLSLKDNLGSVWQIGPLGLGTYQLHFLYENPPGTNQEPSDLWYGTANVNPTLIEIK